MRSSWLVVVALLAACGDNIKLEPPDEVPTFCGNGVVEAGEQCDDNDELKDIVCDATCRLTCGNGVVDAEPNIDELCDTGIASGPGSCPVSCDDNVACTADVMSGSGCLVDCVNSPIGLPANGDGCCPAGAHANNDDDCDPVCGNMVVEPPAEICDTGIASGPGACPTMCNDSNACTSDNLANGGTCQATCTFTPITMPANGDGCCPSGANANNDNDCAPVCGNTVVEPGEQCDDGNTSNNDPCSTACAFLPMAYRFSDLDLRDPHVFISLLGCNDVTDNALFGFSVNSEIQTSIQTDGDADGLLDLAPTLVFRQFSQSASTMPVELHFADCTAPASSSMCSPGGSTAVTGIATNVASGACLAPAPNTTRPYSPAIVTPMATPASACFVTNAVTLTIDVGGIPITLRQAQIAANYVNNPATGMVNGFLRGFISEADANATIIPMNIPLVGGQPLSRLLAGGSGACPSHSDKDNNGVVGWWFYLNFPATRVPWMD